jgi:hypothetical protein
VRRGEQAVTRELLDACFGAADALEGAIDAAVAGAEAPPALADAPGRPAPAAIAFLPRRRTGLALGLAAAIALAAFLGGYLAGYNKNEAFKSTRAIGMHGTHAAALASATIKLGERDASGNWPLRVSVRGLKPLPKGGYYEMYLTRGGRPIAPCGTFNVHEGTTEVYLNAPYKLRRFDGWVVTRHLPRERHGEHGPVLLTT